MNKYFIKTYPESGIREEDIEQWERTSGGELAFVVPVGEGQLKLFFRRQDSPYHPVQGFIPASRVLLGENGDDISGGNFSVSGAIADSVASPEPFPSQDGESQRTLF